MSETSKNDVPIRERLWPISINPYYKKNPETEKYELVDEETIEKLRQQEQDEYNAAQAIIDKKNEQILDDHNFLKEWREKQLIEETRRKNYMPMQNAGRKKRRTGRRKSNKRKSNKRKSHKRRGSRRR